MICPNCNNISTTKGGKCEHCNHRLDTARQRLKQRYGRAPVQCPECGKVSDSIKVYNLPDFSLCLLVYASYSLKCHVGCPSCMRKKILLHGFTYNIVTANLLWLAWIFPMSLIQLIRTCFKGHSWEIIDHIDNTQAQRY